MQWQTNYSQYLGDNILIKGKKRGSLQSETLQCG